MAELLQDAALAEAAALLLVPEAARYAHLPGGHQEGWADAFCNVMRDVYGFIADGRSAAGERPPAFATFEDGYHSACVVDAVLESHRRGSVWTPVEALTMEPGRREVRNGDRSVRT